MTIVTSYDFESDSWTHHNGELPARQAWREAVAEIAAKAKETLPECNGRVDKAVAIVLAGDVELLDGGKAKVASQSNGTRPSTNIRVTSRKVASMSLLGHEVE